MSERNGKVVVAYIHPGQISGAFHDSLFQLFVQDAHKGANARILNGGGNISITSGPRISQARNDLVQGFLGHPNKPEWLWMLDTDMLFGPDTLEGLLESADPETHPIVGGLCFGGGKSGTVFPTIYHLREPTLNTGVVQVVHNYPKNSLLQVDATGAACLLMHRDALVKIGKKYEGVAPWFSEGAYAGVSFGEDWTFCMRAQSVDIPIYVNTAVKIGHMKNLILDEDTHAEYLKRAELIGDGGIVQDFQKRMQGVSRAIMQPPNYVVIPFRDKAELTLSLLDQLESQPYECIFLYDNGSSDEEAQEVMDGIKHRRKVLLLRANGESIHRMWNRGIERAHKDVFSRVKNAPKDAVPCFNVTFMNNDLKIDAELIDRLALALRADDGLWAVSPRYDDRPGVGVSKVHSTAGKGGMAGFCFMVKGEAFNFGLPKFDEQLKWWYGDDDLVQNIEKSGFSVGLVHGTWAEHLEGGSLTAKEHPELEDVRAADADYLISKWGDQVIDLRKETQ